MELEGYLPAGSYTTDDTLNVMERYARKDSTTEVIQGLVSSITSKIGPADKRSQMLAVRNWILGNLENVPDPQEARRLFNPPENMFEGGDLEMVKSPLAVIESGKYDCDCAATLIASMLLALGIPVRFVAVAFHGQNITGPDGYSHVFAQGHDGADWLTIDPVSHPSERQMLADSQQTKIRYL